MSFYKLNFIYSTRFIKPSDDNFVSPILANDEYFREKSSSRNVVSFHEVTISITQFQGS